VGLVAPSSFFLSFFFFLFFFFFCGGEVLLDYVILMLHIKEYMIMGLRVSG
jgi:hypothetical protein